MLPRGVIARLLLSWGDEKTLKGVATRQHAQQFVRLGSAAASVFFSVQVSHN